MKRMKWKNYAGFPPLGNWLRRCHNPALHRAVREGFVKDRKGFARSTGSSCQNTYLKYTRTTSNHSWNWFIRHLIYRWRLRLSSRRCRNSPAELPQQSSHKLPLDHPPPYWSYNSQRTQEGNGYANGVPCAFSIISYHSPTPFKKRHANW